MAIFEAPIFAICLRTFSPPPLDLERALALARGPELNFELVQHKETPNKASARKLKRSRALSQALDKAQT